MTYSTMLREWKDLSATRPINQFAYTPAGVLSMMTPDANAATGVIDLAPLDTLSAATREHERRRAAPFDQRRREGDVEKRRGTAVHACRQPRLREMSAASSRT